MPALLYGHSRGVVGVLRSFTDNIGGCSILVTWTVFGFVSALVFNNKSLFDFLILCLGAGTGKVARDLISESVSELLVSTCPGLRTLGSSVYATITDISQPLSGEDVRTFSPWLSLSILDPDFVELHDSVGVNLQGCCARDSETHFK